MEHSIWLYIAVMSLVSYLIRVLPVTLIRRQIKNRFLRSVLYYLPYVPLSVMTVPAIFSISLVNGFRHERNSSSQSKCCPGCSAVSFWLH